MTAAANAKKAAEDVLKDAEYQNEIAAFAALDDLTYRKTKKSKAKELGLTISDLDKLVAKERRKARDKSIQDKDPLAKRGFTCDGNGLWWRDPFADGAPHQIAGSLKVRATTRDAQSNTWGMLIEWEDQDRHNHSWAMPRSALAGDPSDVYRSLLDGGLFVSPNRKDRERLIEYLMLCNPLVRARCIDRTGWCGERTHARYVLPSGDVIGSENGEEIALQTTSPLRQPTIAGDLGGWKSNVAARCVGNSRLLTAMSASFVGPLLNPLNEESFCIHFEGSSSIGKTGLARVAASTWGIELSSWRTTDNSAESWFAAANDGLLILDEISQVDSRAADALAYMLAAGSGKGRANRNGAARPVATWRTITISTGEIGLAEKLAETGRRVRGGQLVRVIEIPADAGAGLGVFENLHGFADGAALTDTLKESIGQHCGHAARAFIEKIADRLPKMIEAVRKYRDKWIREHSPKSADGQVQRVAAKFALIAAAGQLATGALDLPWPSDAASDAAATCFEAWLNKRGGSQAHEIVAGIASVRRFIEQYGESRFSVLSGQDNRPSELHTINNRAGWRRRVIPDDTQSGWEYLVLPEAWKNDLCAGFNASTIARVLRDKMLLVGGSDGKTSTTITIPGHPKMRIYRLSGAILADEGEHDIPHQGHGGGNV
jgi:putative DNA primase/helicase